MTLALGKMVEQPYQEYDYEMKGLQEGEPEPVLYRVHREAGHLPDGALDQPGIISKVTNSREMEPMKAEIVRHQLEKIGHLKKSFHIRFAMVWLVLLGPLLLY